MLDAPTTPLDGRNPTAVYFGQRINVACQSQRFGLREHLFSQPSQSFLSSCSPTPRLFWEILVGGGASLYTCHKTPGISTILGFRLWHKLAVGGPTQGAHQGTLPPQVLTCARRAWRAGCVGTLLASSSGDLAGTPMPSTGRVFTWDTGTACFLRDLPSLLKKKTRSGQFPLGQSRPLPEASLKLFIRSSYENVHIPEFSGNKQPSMVTHRRSAIETA